MPCALNSSTVALPDTLFPPDFAKVHSFTQKICKSLSFLRTQVKPDLRKFGLTLQLFSSLLALSVILVYNLPLAINIIPLLPPARTLAGSKILSQQILRGNEHGITGSPIINYFFTLPASIIMRPSTIPLIPGSKQVNLVVGKYIYIYKYATI